MTGGAGSAPPCACATSAGTRRRRTASRARSAPVALPAEVAAGSRTSLAIRVRNTGSWTWSSAASLPVQIGARIVPVAGGQGPAGEPRFVLPREVAPGESLETEIVLEWPTVPGRYRVSLDLVVEDLTWFADEVGAPLASGEIEVREP